MLTSADGFNGASSSLGHASYVPQIVKAPAQRAPSSANRYEAGLSDMGNQSVALVLAGNASGAAAKDVAALIDANEAPTKKRGPYKKKAA